MNNEFTVIYILFGILFAIKIYKEIKRYIKKSEERRELKAMVADMVSIEKQIKRNLKKYKRGTVADALGSDLAKENAETMHAIEKQINELPSPVMRGRKVKKITATKEIKKHEILPGAVMDIDTEAFTVPEFAMIHKVSHQTVRNWIQRGKIKGKKVGGKWRIYD